MTALPAKSTLDGSKTPSTTVGEMKVALGTVRDFLAELLGEDSANKAAARKVLGAAGVTSNVLAKNVGGNVTVNLTDDEALNDVFVFTGALTANIAVTVPTPTKTWSVLNNTTGNFSLTLKTVAGTGISVVQGKSRQLYCDGTNVVRSFTDYSDLSDGVGRIETYANGATVPPGLLALPVAATNISRTAYAALYAVMGTAWGSGDGATTFGMPWCPTGYALLQGSGATVATLTVGSNLSHSHSGIIGNALNGSVSTAGGGSIIGVQSNGTDTVIGSNGGSANLPAGIYVKQYVRYQGVFP